MIYLLRDDFFGEQRLAELRASLGPPEVQSLNAVTLDGARLTLGELRAAAEALPFLGEYRLVVVRRLFSATAGRRSEETGGEPTGARRAASERDKEFLAYLARVPPSTWLVLLEDQDFSATHPAVKATQAAKGETQPTGPLGGAELSRWVTQRVRAKGGSIDRAAVELLAAGPVDDARQLDLSLDALVTYADGAPIQPADVQTLVPQSRAADVFVLVDAVGQRDRMAALGGYRRLVAGGAAPIYVLVMLTRQFRLLLLARDALDHREDPAGALKQSPWVAQKLGQQARHFSVERCLRAFDQLLATDLAIKTGLADDAVAVEALLVDLTT